MLFFNNIAQEFNILNPEAQQLYKNFIAHLIADFDKKYTFTIPHFLTVRKINNAYLVEIDSNLQIVFNPISVESRTEQNATIPANKSTSTHLQHQERKEEVLHSKGKKISSIPLTLNIKNTKFEEKKYSSKKEKILIKKHINRQSKTMIYFIIILIFLSITLIAVKFLVFSNHGYLSSLSK
ncbi:MAG: hypothetical protein ACRC0A_04005 [Chitinophagaceae bacterium]